MSNYIFYSIFGNGLDFLGRATVFQDQPDHREIFQKLFRSYELWPDFCGIMSKFRVHHCGVLTIHGLCSIQDNKSKIGFNIRKFRTALYFLTEFLLQQRLREHFLKIQFLFSEFIVENFPFVFHDLFSSVAFWKYFANARNEDAKSMIFHFVYYYIW